MRRSRSLGHYWMRRETRWSLVGYNLQHCQREDATRASGQHLDSMPQPQQTGMLDERALLAISCPTSTGEPIFLVRRNQMDESASNECLRENRSTVGGLNNTESVCTGSLTPHHSEGPGT